MPDQGISIGGDWTGVYDYGDGGPDFGGDAVPFTAMLFDLRGVIWGSIREPNRLAAIPSRELFADISGSRRSREVVFTKTYEGAPPGYEMPVAYAGQISSGGQRIEGRWTIRAPLGDISGPFVMNRLRGVALTRATERSREVEVLR